MKLQLISSIRMKIALASLIRVDEIMTTFTCPAKFDRIRSFWLMILRSSKRLSDNAIYSVRTHNFIDGQSFYFERVTHAAKSCIDLIDKIDYKSVIFYYAH